MKFLNKKQKNNKGFSLVELIVVIAIMVVLVAVLAPVFTKYIESSRRATDVQNANSIAESVLADVADRAKWYTDGTGYVDGTVLEASATNKTPTALKEDVKTKGNASGKNQSFYFSYDSATNKCKVTTAASKPTSISDDLDLTNETAANNYKNAESEGAFK